MINLIILLIALKPQSMNRKDKIKYLLDIEAGIRKLKKYYSQLMICEELNNGNILVNSRTLSGPINGKWVNEHSVPGEVTREEYKRMYDESDICLGIFIERSKTNDLTTTV